MDSVRTDGVSVLSRLDIEQTLMAFLPQGQMKQIIMVSVLSGCPSVRRGLTVLNW